MLTGDGDEVHARTTTERRAYTEVHLEYRLAPGPVLVDLEEGSGMVRDSSIADTLLGLDDPGIDYLSLDGSEGDDRLFGRNIASPDSVVSDVISGLRGDDEVYGRAGERDALYGGQGDDALDGGPGRRDEGVGGKGSDTCVRMEWTRSCSPPDK
jgi:Ca2+-binding RTX toxin-like protein